MTSTDVAGSAVITDMYNLTPDLLPSEFSDKKAEFGGPN